MKLPSIRRGGGFTLIEILVAMGIFCMVVAAIYSTWMCVIRGSRAVQDATAQTQRERITVRTLEQALASTHSFVADVDHYAFVIENKSASTLSFAARLPRSFPRSGRFGDFDMRRVTFSLEADELVMRQCPILMAMDEDEQQHPLELAKNVKSFKVEAMDPQKGEWTDEWLLTNQIPTLVRVTIMFASPKNPWQDAGGFQRVINIPSVAVDALWQVPGGFNPGLPQNNLNNQNQNPNQNPNPAGSLPGGGVNVNPPAQ